MTTVREERPEDISAIRVVEERAFGRPDEADLVDTLRRSGKAVISLVATEGEQVVGHILFSPATVECGESRFNALALAPVAVLPERQGRGIGSRLVRRGLEECLRRGHEAVFLIGHADYYPRFGFGKSNALGIRCEFDVSDEVFMVAELREGALNGVGGVMKFQPEFNHV